MHFVTGRVGISRGEMERSQRWICRIRVLARAEEAEIPFSGYEMDTEQEIGMGCRVCLKRRVMTSWVSPSSFWRTWVLVPTTGSFHISNTSKP